MKQSIQLRLGQHLTMTPQLQQAIRLLQLSTLELQLEVQGVLDSNLMLEVDEGDAPSAAEVAAETGQQVDKESTSEGPEGSDAELASRTDTIPDELPVDTS
jgi:RNA polymerase sigma-54 factor